MARRKRQPYNPVKVHDRMSKDLLKNAKVSPIDIDDPYEPGAKIRALRSTRNDPLASMHARNTIDDAQYQGGRAFQADFETAERGPRAIDPAQEAVDGGAMPEPITEAQRKAARQLAAVYRVLGQHGSALVHDVLIHAMTMEQVGWGHGASENERKYAGRRFRECLDSLAVFYGFSHPQSVQNYTSD